MDLSVLIWINLQPEAPQPQVFRFEQDVFCGSCAVEGPFVREADAFFLAYDNDGSRCFSCRACYDAVVGNGFDEVFSCYDDEVSVFLISYGSGLHACLDECQELFIRYWCQLFEITAFVMVTMTLNY